MRIETKIILIMFALLLISIGLLVKANKAISIRDRHIAEQQAYIAELENHVPTFKELQRKVGAEPDGKICEMWNIPGHSKTLEKWDKAICQQEAARYNYFYEEPK